MLFLILLLSLSSLFAQDAAQVLRVRVGFTTLKNSTTLTDAQRAEVERLAATAREANGAAHYGEALKYLYHGIAVMRGVEWTALAELSSSLTLKLDRAVVGPSSKVEVKLGQLFPLDQKLDQKLAVNIALLPAMGDEPVKLLATAGPVDGDLTTPLTSEVIIPKVADGSYRISVSLRNVAAEAAAAAPVTKSANIRIEDGLAEKVAAAKERVLKTTTTLQTKNSKALLAVLPTAEYEVSLFDLANAGEISPGRTDFDGALKEANGELDALSKFEDPLAARRGDFLKAYRSDVDRTLQPYRIFVPASYDGTKPYPLIVALHGMGGDESSYFDLYGRGAFKVEAERRGYIVACPKGRQPTSMYLGTAQKDVLDVLAEVGRAYRVDPDRIYLTGHSMGGYGTWSVAMAHPELFAAIAPISGGGNPSGLTKIAQIPELVVHGDNDKTVSVEESRRMVAAAKSAGVELKYIEIPGGDHNGAALRTFGDVFDWFDAHKKPPAAVPK